MPGGGGWCAHDKAWHRHWPFISVPLCTTPIRGDTSGCRRPGLRFTKGKMTPAATTINSHQAPLRCHAKTGLRLHRWTSWVAKKCCTITGCGHTPSTVRVFDSPRAHVTNAAPHTRHAAVHVRDTHLGYSLLDYSFLHECMIITVYCCSITRQPSVLADV